MPRDRVDVRLTMTEQDLRLVVSALNDYQGATGSEKLRCYLQVTFERLLDEFFPEAEEEEED